MYFDELNEKVGIAVKNALVDAKETASENVGLDERASKKMYIGEDFIAVKKINDRTLQYYGGFEYVSQDCRAEMGDYVFYYGDDSRVQDCISRFENAES